MILHDKYNDVSLDNDVALIKTSEPAVLSGENIVRSKINNVTNQSFSAYTALIKLPNHNDTKNHTGEIGTTAGFGLIRDVDPVLSDYLRYVTNPILADNEVRKYTCFHKNILILFLIEVQDCLDKLEFHADMHRHYRK